MLRGLSTLSFYADDLDAATDWYAELLGIRPYFQVPGYVEFRLGDYQHELGIIDSAYAGSELSRTPAPAATGPAGAVAFWHVDDVTVTLDWLLARGATAHDLPRDRGEGFVTASVVDPFGNVLGVMSNPHYVEVLAGGAHAALRASTLRR